MDSTPADTTYSTYTHTHIHTHTHAHTHTHTYTYTNTPHSKTNDVIYIKRWREHRFSY